MQGVTPRVTKVFRVVTKSPILAPKIETKSSHKMN